MKATENAFVLSNEACDQVADLVADFCTQLDIDRKDALRYRLSAEECLLFWMDHGCQGRTVTVQTGQRILQPYIRLSIEGPPMDPFRAEKSDYGSYCSSVLVNLKLQPEYSYEGNTNRILFLVKKKEMGQLPKLLLVILSAALVGILGNLFLPAHLLSLLLDGLIAPIYDTFFNILSCIAGPMIFLSVAWGIYGIGDAATLGRVGKKMMLYYLAVTFLAALFAGLFYPLLGPALAGGSTKTAQLDSILTMLLGIFPSTIIEPFATGNTLQIIFLAFVIGIALLFLGKKTASLASAIDQVNALVHFLMDVICRLVPFVVFLVIVNFIWSRQYAVIGSLWRFLVVMLAAGVLACTVNLIYTALRVRAKPKVLLKKSLPTFMIALATASSAAAFGSNVSTCEKEFGIDPSICGFGIPLGMVIHKPISAINNLLLAFYFARVYGVECSAEWIIMAILIAWILAVATPPIPGGGAIAYSMLLSQLGIPSEGLAVILALDILTDFIITALEMFMLPLSLIQIANRLGIIGQSVLRNEKA